MMSKALQYVKDNSGRAGSTPGHRQTQDAGHYAVGQAHQCLLQIQRCTSTDIRKKETT